MVLSCIFTTMITVNIIGSGNVSFHLIKGLSDSSAVKIMCVAGRNIPKIKQLLLKLPNTQSIKVCTLENLTPAQVNIIAVSDNAIADVSDHLPFTDALVVHTSGSIPIEKLSAQNRGGVFYPLQTFTKEKNINWSEVPFCIESEIKEDTHLLKTLTAQLSSKIYELNSAQRAQLHIAAVFANNFTNHCLTIAEDVCETNKIPFELLHPLILETAKKAVTTAPKQNQTGPAIRNDQTTITQQLLQLKGKPKKIYKLLTKAIQKTHGKKL